MGSTNTPRGNANALNAYMSQIISAANRTGIDPWILGAVIMHESGGEPGKIQPNGQGRGLMQVDGGYHSEAYDPRMTGKSPSDIQFQIDTGANILRDSIKAAGGDLTQGLQNYAGSNYRGPNGVGFAQELADSYVSPVLQQFVDYGFSKGNFSLANAANAAAKLGAASIVAGKVALSGPQAAKDIGTNAVNTVTDIGSVFQNIVTFFSTPNNWIKIAIGFGGFLLVMFGLFGAFTHSETGQTIIQKIP